MTFQGNCTRKQADIAIVLLVKWASNKDEIEKEKKATPYNSKD